MYMKKLELRSKFNKIYDIHLLFYRCRNMRPQNKISNNELSPQYLNNFLEELKELTDEEYLAKLKEDNQDSINRAFDQFYEMYSFLSNYSGLKNLLKKFTGTKIDAKIDCFIAELVIAYLIVKKNPNIDIEYEPREYKHPPEFKIKVKNVTYYIQVKSLLKSISYNENIDKQFESNHKLMVSVNNTPQVVTALKKATQFTPNDDNCFFIIIQYISNDVIQTNDLIGDQLYGEEVMTAYVMSDDSIVWKNSRTQIDEKNCEQHGGFFYSENGKKVDAYVKATGTRGVFFPYMFEMFINNQKESDKSPIYDILNIDRTYNYSTWF